ncbi:XkdX family protein [Bacillus glycinifermentans]|uniref:XkdX family protein n=1 Tax=Bacillus glycinifermentans TaxID=1664069 RepID=A0AAJ4D4I1_9BACI|nr:XkdX family protein [Bacillus glycinifermentans]QAT64736.1 XkdX family protein [Bacillus glycinifermentans]QAT67092.1 XkdX family protein [Bacillus glycinifermentans]
MIDWFTYIKGFYEKGLWTKKQVYDVVAVGRITPEQYEEIIGEPYDPNTPPSEDPSEETSGSIGTNEEVSGQEA